MGSVASFSFKLYCMSTATVVHDRMNRLLMQARINSRSTTTLQTFTASYPTAMVPGAANGMRLHAQHQRINKKPPHRNVRIDHPAR
jgi:hypothetical protein